MRVENGQMVTLEQDIEHIWGLHGWELLEEIVPAHPDTTEATWIIKAKPRAKK